MSRLYEPRAVDSANSIASRWLALDGLRGIAILLVLFFHVWKGCSGTQRYDGDFFPLAWVYAGNTGVTLFFLLSGFLVSRPFIEARRIGAHYSIRHYIIQRALRILPAYLVVAGIGLVVTGKYSEILSVLSFTARAFDVGFFSAVWWSLDVEIQFYILFPCVFAVFAMAGRWQRYLLVALLVLLYANAAARFCLPGFVRYDLKMLGLLLFSVLGQLPAFAAGIALQAWLMPRLKIAWGRSASLLVVALTAMTAFFVQVARIGSLEFSFNNAWYVLPEALGWCLVVWVVLHSDSITKPMLGSVFLRYFGKISYSLYLVHMPVLALVTTQLAGMDPFFMTFLALSLSILAAHLLWHVVERPALAFKQKMATRLVARGVPVFKPAPVAC